MHACILRHLGSFFKLNYPLKKISKLSLQDKESIRIHKDE